ncbi:hypothetical protein C8Q78DRAFT_1072936 [Trametes maxima]|nr:hypothetical protein C8Q78DRAFT_1072936 [Trametes maxima]
MKRENHEGIDEFCKLAITRNRMRPSFKNKRAFFQNIDKLPTGPGWICDIVDVVGDEINAKGEPLTEELELWRRDPVECIRELIGNPAFKDHMSYAPVKVTRDGGKLPEGATISPLFVASDKTQLTVLRGDQTAWPAVRRKPSAHATVLIGYIPVSKGLCFSTATRSAAGYRLFHTCMARILHPLVNAGQTGVAMTCADGLVRRVYPILAGYIADHPEQCLIACCKENRCPRCVVSRKKRGENRTFALRDHAKTAELLRRAGQGDTPAAYTSQGLRPVYKPFWADLPHVDVFACITPDILHQLHKGVVKDHLIVWSLDERFAAIHFHRGISKISQWTGSEAKEVEKVLLGLLVGRIPLRALKAIRGLLDFVYYAQYEVHSQTTLGKMKQALNTFHRHKQALIDLGVREHFNIPKLHSLIHYVEAIERLGCLDGVNTESSERLHIDYAKKAYRATSRKDYVSQMTLWLQRQEAVVRRDAYLAWVNQELERELEEDKLRFEDVDGEYDPKDGGKGDECEEDDSAQDDDFVQPANVQVLRDLVHSNVSRAYQLPLTPSARRVSLDTLITRYGATDILLELNEFLREAHPANLQLTAHTLHLDVFHSVAILLPANVHFANEKRLCKVRAVPATPRDNDRKATAARFDCALFIQDEECFRSVGGLEGLRPGQVQVIFRLPAWVAFDEPLVYVKWFRPFRSPDAITGLAPTSHSTRTQRRNTSIMRVSDILRPCHLIPKFGQDDSNPEWKENDILDESITFVLNRYLDFHFFHFLSP